MNSEELRMNYNDTQEMLCLLIQERLTLPNGKKRIESLFYNKEHLLPHFQIQNNEDEEYIETGWEDIPNVKELPVIFVRKRKGREKLVDYHCPYCNYNGRNKTRHLKSKKHERNVERAMKEEAMKEKAMKEIVDKEVDKEVEKED